MKKIPFLSLILAFILLFGCMSGYATEKTDVSVTAGCRSVDAKLPLGGSEKLVETAGAVVLYELNTDTLVYGWNMDARIDPTGMVKILTVLVALDHCDLEEVVTVGDVHKVAELIGSVSAKLQKGEQIKMKDLLYCIMVASANDAAYVLAEHVSQTQSGFVELMNAKAAELGCTDSKFANVHGLSGTDQYTTARDLARITEAALENPLFTEMFCAEEYTVPATNKSEERRMLTTNYMMSDTYTGKYYDSRLTGGKTAAASLTDRSLICTAEVGTSRYLCVLMSAEAEVSDDGFEVKYYGSFEETKTVLDYGFRNFEVRQVVDHCQSIAQYAVPGGENHVVVHPSQDLYTVLPKDVTAEDLQWNSSVDADLLQLPIHAEMALGTLELRYNGLVLGTCELLAMHDVATDGSVIENAPYLEKEPVKRIDYKGILIKIGIVLLVLVVLAAVILVVIRLVNTARVRQQHRRRMRNRRRSR